MKIETAVIMAGGKGLRLRPYTYMIPKPLLPYKDYTILEDIIKKLTSYGIKEIFIVATHVQRKYLQCLDFNKKYNITINLIFEYEEKGTFGGLYYLRNYLKKDFLLMNGDIITDLNYRKLMTKHLLNKSKLTICIKKFSYQMPYGEVIRKPNNHNAIGYILEKPIYKWDINAGIYLVNPEILKHLDGNKINFNQYLKLILDEYEINYYEIKEYWLDVGNDENYKKANGLENAKPL